jgi:hypothetical protein
MIVLLKKIIDTSFYCTNLKDVSIIFFNNTIIKIIIPEANKFIIEFG